MNKYNIVYNGFSGVNIVIPSLNNLIVRGIEFNGWDIGCGSLFIVKDKFYIENKIDEILIIAASEKGEIKLSKLFDITIYKIDCKKNSIYFNYGQYIDWYEPSINEIQSLRNKNLL